MHISCILPKCRVFGGCEPDPVGVSAKLNHHLMVGATRTCDSRESLVQVGKVAGATWVSRWCNSGQSLVQLRAVAGVTLARRNRPADSPHLRVVKAMLAGRVHDVAPEARKACDLTRYGSRPQKARKELR